MKNYILTLLLSVSSLFAQADYSTLLLLNSGTAPCATTDTTLPHDTLLEGFGIPTTGYETNWTSGGTGTGVTFNPAADTSALTTGKPDGACNQAIQVTVNQADALEQSVYWNYGSAIDVDTVAVDVYFYIYVTTIPDGVEDISIIGFGNNTSPDNASSSAFRCLVKANGSNFSLFCNGTTSSSDASGLAVNTWHKVKVHLDTTEASSYLQVNDGSTLNFQRRTTIDPRYLHIGSSFGASIGDSLTCYLDLVTVDFP